MKNNRSTGSAGQGVHFRGDLGRQVRLRVIQDGVPAPIRLSWGMAGVTDPPRARGSPAGRVRKSCPCRLAARRLPQLVEAWAGKAELAFKKVLVTEQFKRWGSCSNGTLRFNWRIMQAPKSLVDYVVAHKVVHLLHEHHQPAFWATLGRLLPDYEARKARLKELGPRLVW